MSLINNRGVNLEFSWLEMSLMGKEAKCDHGYQVKLTWSCHLLINARVFLARHCNWGTVAPGFWTLAVWVLDPIDVGSRPGEGGFWTRRMWVLDPTDMGSGPYGVNLEFSWLEMSLKGKEVKRDRGYQVKLAWSCHLLIIGV